MITPIKNMGIELKYKDVLEKIIGAFFEVHKFLSNGFQEVIYQRALTGASFFKSVKSLNPYKSVIQTIYDMIKAYGGELKEKTKEARPDDPVGRGEFAQFINQLPIKTN